MSATRSLWKKRAIDFCGKVQKAKHIKWNDAMDYITTVRPP